MALQTRRWFEAAAYAPLIRILRPLMTLEPSLSSFVVTLGLRGALNRALDVPIFRSVSGFGSLEYGIVDAEMIGGSCLCDPNTHTKALHDFCNLLVFV